MFESLEFSQKVAITPSILISVNFDSPETHIPHLHNRMCESIERKQLAMTYLQEWAGRVSNMNKNSSSSSLYTEDTSLHCTAQGNHLFIVVAKS